MQSYKTNMIVSAVCVAAICLGLTHRSAQGQGCPNPQVMEVYTTAAEFGEDEYPHNNFNNLSAGGDQLAIPDSPEVFPYVWVACSARGTIVRIATEAHYSWIHERNVEPGEILGEYRTAPDGCGKNPSRTTVDFDGNAWCANRNDNFYGGGCEGPSFYMGSVVKIGSGWMHQWIDRNNNGLIDTSTGLDLVMDWDADADGDGVCSAGDIAGAQDELILLYEPVPPTGTRTIAVDRENNVWVGGSDNRWHVHLDGQTGQMDMDVGILEAPEDPCGGYGGLVDCNGVLWSATGDLDPAWLLRHDPTSQTPTTECILVERSYGLAVDLNGYIWNTQRWLDTVLKIDPDPPFERVSFGTGDYPQGVAITAVDNHVWVADRIDRTVTRRDNDGGFVKTISLAYEGHQGEDPTGVAVDSAGMVWVTNLISHDVMVIDPTMEDGEVVLRVDLNDVNGDPHSLGDAGPYNYSDMTGLGLMWTISPAGVWTGVVDGDVAGRPWESVSWNATEGAGTVTVQARAADLQTELGKALYVEVGNGEPLVVDRSCTLTGRYLQIRVQLNADCHDPDRPTLQDLTVSAYDFVDDYCEGGNGTADCCEPDCNGNGTLDPCEQFDDCDANGVPDECQEDCNENSVADVCDLTAGAVTFEDVQSYLVGDQPMSVAGRAWDASGAEILLDVDSDGDVDLVTANIFSDDNLSILLNNGNGRFTLGTPIPVGENSDPHTVVAGDFNDDGYVDLAVTRRDGNPEGADDVAIVFNLGGEGANWSGFDQANIQFVQVGNGPERMATADLDGDCDLDLVIANRGNPDNVSVLYNDGSGTFAGVANSPFALNVSSADPRDLVVGDLNGDGLPDIAVATGGPGKLVVGINAGGSDSGLTFSDWGTTTQYSIGSGDTFAISVSLADLDHDGDLDVAIADSGDCKAVAVLINRGMYPLPLEFDAPVVYPVEGNSRHVITPDVDGDLFADVVVVNSSGDLSVLSNDRTGQLELSWQINVPGGSFEHVTAAPLFDPDGQTDLAIADRRDWVRVMLNLTVPPASIDLLNDGIPDECQCPAATIVDADPPYDPSNPLIDARQPHPVNDNSFGARQGIGSPNTYNGGPEPIQITLTDAATGADNLNCWELCETGIEQWEGTPHLEPNEIISVTETSPGVYEILLDRPISAGHWTVITYVGDGSRVSYASLPADANADGWSGPVDILDLIEYLNEVAVPPYGNYSTDIDHSGEFNSADILREIDLLTGAGTFIVWNGKELADNICIGLGGGGGGGPGGDGGGPPPDEDHAFADGFVTYLTTAVASEPEEVEEFSLIVEALTGWCVEDFPYDERAALAQKLKDPSLEFASPVGEAMVPDIVAALLEK